MGFTPPPILVPILRSTLQLVEYYGGTDAQGPQLAELTDALQRSIVAIEATTASSSVRPGSIPHKKP
jgi:hypothetical protein